MKGAQHYRTAERLVSELTRNLEARTATEAAISLQLAQVHSTLALAAATALNAPDHVSPVLLDQWREVGAW